MTEELAKKAETRCNLLEIDNCEYKTFWLDGYEQGQKEGYKKATERAYERQQDLTDTYVKDGKKIEQLKKENEELKKKVFVQEEIIIGEQKEIEELKWEQKQILEDNDNYQKENEELKGQVEWLEKCELELGEMLGEANKKIEELNDFSNSQCAKLLRENTELKTELEKWKEEHHEQVILANEEGWNRTQLQIENNELKKDKEYLDKVNNEQTEVILKLNEQIEKMKNHVYANIKWADQNKNNQMWQKLIKMMNEWELK